MEVVEYNRMFTQEDTHWWYQQRLSLVTQLVHRYAPPGQRVLDAGCGTGLVLSHLQHEYKVTGVDTADQALAYSKQRGLTSLYKQSIGGLRFPAQSFDLVLCLDVLEHVPNEAKALSSFYRVLRPNGVLIITVPAHPWLWSTHDEQMHHVCRYQRSQLKRSLTSAGFKVDWLSYTHAASLPAATVLRTWQRMRRSALRSNTELSQGPFIQHLLGAAGKCENRWLRNHTLICGLSLACVAVKGVKQDDT